MRSVLNVAPRVTQQEILSIGNQPGWTLVRDIMPNDDLPRILLWTIEVPSEFAPCTVHYVEDTRFYTRVLSVDAPQDVTLELLSRLEAKIEHLDAEALFERVANAETPLERVDALFKTTAYVSPTDHDPAYELMLIEGLRQHRAGVMGRAFILVAGWLAWEPVIKGLFEIAQSDSELAKMAQAVIHNHA